MPLFCTSVAHVLHFYLPCAREIPPPSHALAIPFPDESARPRLDLDTTSLEPSQSLSHPPPSRRPPDAALAIASREPTPPPRRGNLIRSCPVGPRLPSLAPERLHQTKCKPLLSEPVAGRQPKSSRSFVPVPD
ncbi:hypothetical protein PVAP13_2KG273600 [Panicum virgatum]|uniref:Uncharacterized protein n=1 Tax=Panicum virgatum TaxID=38727 RepID=A0A8T0VZJ6_PANVG|nr:hypothetical protein PVAP13_2KG273600 [Panicum virgatum]KAG2642413.1 hypothetical protein PVAP13_2KG273600 [Panicum virgatum]KAG2642414.1 hypothetical protein PVAP13_2KG273600 [Panicum virgatum]